MRKWKVLAALACAGAVATAVAVTAMPAAAAAAAFSKVNDWGAGYQGRFTVTNTSSSAITSWRVEFDLPAGSSISQSWSAERTSSGTRYTFTNAGWNGSLAPGAATEFGFIVNGAGTPANCTINGAVCTGAPDTKPTGKTPAVPPSSPAAPPTSGPRPTSPPASPADPRPTTQGPKPTPPAPPTGSTPVAINGQLHVCGVHLCNQYDKPVQLRGMSSHGIQWFGQCVNGAALDALATDWNADVFRIAMYVQEGGYETNPARFTEQVQDYIDLATARGLYVIVDFHTLSPGDPNYNTARAKTFFQAIASRNANKKNIIYEIANEPNGVSWAGIKGYAEQVIPVIRAADPDGVVIVGTRAWSSLGVSEGSSEAEIVGNPVKADNIMYAFHFYAASHTESYRSTVARAATKLPLFVTEFGTQSATGNGGNDLASSKAWIDLLDRLKIGYAMWSWADYNDSNAALRAGTCASGNFRGAGVLSEAGAFIRERVRTPDTFATS